MLLTRLQLAAIGALAAILLVITGVQTIRLHGFLWIDGALDRVEKLQRDNNELRAELKSISSAKNEQKRETGENIKKAGTLRDKADADAKKIEQAPLPGNCETPPEVMGADL